MCFRVLRVVISLGLPKRLVQGPVSNGDSWNFVWTSLDQLDPITAGTCKLLSESVV